MKRISKTDKQYLGRKRAKIGLKQNARRKISKAKVRALREENRKEG